MVDLNALHRELHRALTAASVPPSERGLTLSRSLSGLEPGDAATLATHLVHNFTDTQLLGLGRSGLYALKHAVANDQLERREHALERLDLALKGLGPLFCAEADGLWVVGEARCHGAVTRAIPELADAPQGAVVILISSSDQQAGKAQLCDHYGQCCDELPAACASAVARGSVVLLPIARLSPPSRSVWSRLRAFVQRVPAWA
ncbi:MAG: hypothetical protein IPJ65_41065 [Archangiaceae bacterium]|nr:hypothetical protein [Archangiaceae bacterium]